MPKADFDKTIDEWLERVNKHRGEERRLQLGPYPVDLTAYLGQQRNEWVTTDSIRHYAGALGDRNPLWWNEDYAKRTRWGGIIAPATFTDAIAMPYLQYPIRREPIGVEVRWDVIPGGHKRELFGIIRPGDSLRVSEKWLGLVEKKSKEPRPYRLFIDTNRYIYINQKDETVAVVDGSFPVLISKPDAEGPMYETRKRHKFTDAERDAIYRGYDTETRRGADTLYWEDVVEGEELKTLVVGPLVLSDQVAFFSGVLTGHIPGFAITWDRMKQELDLHWLDPELNVYRHAAEGHFLDGVGIAAIRGGWAIATGHAMDGLLARNIYNWMGDDGVIKKLDTKYRAVTILGDALRLKGKVTKKYSEGDEHLVDIQVSCENQDGLPLVPGEATVQLLSRTL